MGLAEPKANRDDLEADSEADDINSFIKSLQTVCKRLSPSPEVGKPWKSH